MPQEIREKIQILIEKYKRVLASGAVKSYTEEETKKDFILPLFRYLGWDVDDKIEVSAEEGIKSGGRVDYGFYLNGQAKFYLEAKPLRADLNKEEYANQAVRYAWNKGVTWAVLTDFEGIKVFNAQIIDRSLADKLYFEISYSEYLERFDQLWLLSKSAFGQNLIDTEAEKIGKKLQRVFVGVKLYKDLNECREILTHDLAAWNENVSRELLDEGVQKILDRLIFIRVAEDRGIEPPTLIPLLREWENSGKKNEVPLYKYMVGKFRELDKSYDSNLFSEHPFEGWEEYSDATKKVIEILRGKEGYYEYDFKFIPADVLGGVYENYLGHKLAQSKKGMAISKDAKKRKEQGIYYTPAYIVDYIVKNALEPVLDKCGNVADLKKIKVLDPACGSGSFLINALEVIYQKYREFGNEGGVFTKMSILGENLYGVDLDEKAIELARLNLSLAALDKRMQLPPLDHIKNGNSLISGTDKELEKYFGKNFRDKKPFNWQEEFPEVFSQGGFDVIIGNPPYVFARGGSFEDSEKQYYYDHFKLQQYQVNTFLLFIEQGYNLLKQNGEFGFIIPNNWLTINSFSKLREFLLKHTGNLKIINAIDTIFSQASVDTCLLLFKKINPTSVEIGELKNNANLILSKHSPEDFYRNEFVINISRTKNKNAALELKNTILLGEIADVKSGLKAYEVGKGNPPQSETMKDGRIYHSKNKKGGDWLKYLDGVDVGRYFLGWSEEYIKYGDNLAAPRKAELFEKERILVRQIPSSPPYCINAVYTKEHCINDLNSNNILNPKGGYNLKYILGVINSKLISHWFIQAFDKFQRKIFPQFKVNELARFPIYKANPKEQGGIIALTNKMIELNKKLRETEENSNEWETLKSEIEKTDKKIDEEVYRLYELTEEEIKIVEGENA